jgi:hypothetical protein
MAGIQSKHGRRAGLEQLPEYVEQISPLQGSGFSKYPWTGVSAVFNYKQQLKWLMLKLQYWRRNTRQLHFCASELLRILEHLRDGRKISSNDREFALFLMKSTLTDLDDYRALLDTIHRTITQLFDSMGSFGNETK